MSHVRFELNFTSFISMKDLQILLLNSGSFWKFVISEKAQSHFSW